MSFHQLDGSQERAELDNCIFGDDDESQDSRTETDQRRDEGTFYYEYDNPTAPSSPTVAGVAAAATAAMDASGGPGEGNIPGVSFAGSSSSKSSSGATPPPGGAVLIRRASSLLGRRPTLKRLANASDSTLPYDDLDDSGGGSGTKGGMNSNESHMDWKAAEAQMDSLIASRDRKTANEGVRIASKHFERLGRKSQVLKTFQEKVVY